MGKETGSTEKMLFNSLLVFGAIVTLITILDVWNTYRPVEPSVEENINCIGNENCLNEVRIILKNTYKATLQDEKYLGDGMFHVVFVDLEHQKVFNSTIYTDCNCEIIDVDLKQIK